MRNKFTFPYRLQWFAIFSNMRDFSQRAPLMGVGSMGRLLLPGEVSSTLQMCQMGVLSSMTLTIGVITSQSLQVLVSGRAQVTFKVR